MSQARISLLPSEFPSLAGFEIAARMEPAGDSAADFYDVVPLGGGRVALVLGDVVVNEDETVGRGLVSAGCQSLFREAIRSTTDAVAALNLLNEYLQEEMPANSFVMCSLFVLDPQEKTAVHAGAGHQSFHFGAGQSTPNNLESTGMPLGLFDQSEYTMNGPIAMDAGALCLMVSDGFQHAFSPQHSLFGTEGIFDAVAKGRQNSAEEIVGGLFSSVRDFQRGQSSHEDLTALVIRAT